MMFVPYSPGTSSIENIKELNKLLEPQNRKANTYLAIQESNKFPHDRHAYNFRDL